jgi:hypothetical protein
LPQIYKSKMIDCGNHIRTHSSNEYIAYDYTIDREDYSKAEQGEKSLYSLRRTIDDLCLTIDTNITKYSKFITLTFRETTTDRAYALNCFKVFQIYFKRHFGYNMKYISISELQTHRGFVEDNMGSWHFHMVLFIDQKLDFKKLKKCWPYGSVDLRVVKNCHGIGRYFTKYFTKQIKEDLDQTKGPLSHAQYYELNDRLIFKSRDLKKPITSYDTEIPPGYTLNYEVSTDHIDEKTGMIQTFTIRDYYKDLSFIPPKKTIETPPIDDNLLLSSFA